MIKTYTVLDKCGVFYHYGDMKRQDQVTVDEVKAIFRQCGGVLRTGEALKYGIHPKTLYTMRDRGILETLSRGLYRLKDISLGGNDDLVTVVCRIPKARICLISALSFHEITTQIPHEVYCAIPRDIHQPRIDYPPVRFFRFSESSYLDGVESHTMSGTTMQVYNVEKTLADCFKYRNQIGMDVVLEALHLYRERKSLKVDELLYHARICNRHWDTHYDCR